MKYRNRTIKVQEQLVVPSNGDYQERDGYLRTGTVACPYCGKAAERWTPKQRGFEIMGDACEHAKGIVSAGGFSSAIHFESAKEVA
jgi:hypothetical protein